MWHLKSYQLMVVKSLWCVCIPLELIFGRQRDSDNGEYKCNELRAHRQQWHVTNKTVHSSCTGSVPVCCYIGNDNTSITAATATLTVCHLLLDRPTTVTEPLPLSPSIHTLHLVPTVSVLQSGILSLWISKRVPDLTPSTVTSRPT